MLNTRRFLAMLAIGFMVTVPASFAGQKHPQAKSHPAYNSWGDNDKQNYNQYAKQHHIGDKTYNDLTPAQQQQYWNWRDKHPVNLGHPDSEVGMQNPNGRGVYDPSTGTNRQWTGDDQQNYNQYAKQHHIGDKAYNDLTPQQQSQYWAWRQKHPVNLGHPNSGVGQDRPTTAPTVPPPTPTTPPQQ